MMAELKRTTYTFYKAKSILSFGSVNSNPDEEKTLEGIKTAIDRSNNVVVKNDKLPYQYQIIKTTVCSVYDNNDLFVERSTFEQAVEKYPISAPKTPFYYVVYEDKKKCSLNVYGLYASTYDLVKAVSMCENTPGTYVEKKIKAFSGYDPDHPGEVVYRCSK